MKNSRGTPMTAQAHLFWYRGETSSFLLETGEFLGAFDRIQLSQEILVAAIGDDWPSDRSRRRSSCSPTASGRFPSGARKLPSELVSAVQRER